MTLTRPTSPSGIALTAAQRQTLLARAPLPQRPPPRLEDRSIAVTGAAGSIGSGLVAALTQLGAKSLLALDRNETELVRLARAHNLAPGQITLADINDRVAVERAFERHRPDLVLHAAAVKHLPLLESQVGAAIRDNALATRRVLDLADTTGADLLLVSSDKAASARSVLGASKRLAERLCLERLPARSGKTTAVRLANVLGSRGSVLDRWLHPATPQERVRIAPPGTARWFLSLDEATSLLLALLHEDIGSGLFAPVIGEPTEVTALFDRATSIWPHLASRPRQAWDLLPSEARRERFLGPAERGLPTPDPTLMAVAGPPLATAPVEEELRRWLALPTEEARRAALFAS